VFYWSLAVRLSTATGGRSNPLEGAMPEPRTLAGAATVFLLLAGSAGWAKEPAALEPLAFLVGEWPSSGTGQPGATSGKAVFARRLQDRVIVRTSDAEYPGPPGQPASRHEDLMIIFAPAEGGVRADYYDNEGHVIRYAVEVPAPGRAVFLSDPVAGQPRFRLTYALEAPGVLAGEFAIAPPGAADAFKPYLTWTSRQATPGR
jgi:hypothetical protein